ncbi:MAG: TVP38/TMEM64 family protein [Candidatus Tectomicrobia bacterium]|nr:TVP38/TMEM64 family protein [Candidatus Tectomicrobia bacterium]
MSGFSRDGLSAQGTRPGKRTPETAEPPDLKGGSRETEEHLLRTATPWRVFILGSLVAAIATGFIFLPVRESLRLFLEWVETLGFWGPVLLAAAYTPACIFYIPGWILTTGSGFAFGVPLGTAAVSVGSVIGASAAFLLGRTLARDWVEKRVLSNPTFRAIDRAVEENGFKIVLLTRLSPVFPFNLLNYAFGITKVRFRDYVLASWIGMLPGTVMYVYLGSAAKSLTDLAAGGIAGGMERQALFGIGLAATLVLTVLITRMARKAMKDALALRATESARTE